MSIVNLGIQCIQRMRSLGSNEFENCVTKCDSLKDLREACTSFKEDITISLKEPKDLLSSIMVRLESKGEKFHVFESATKREIEDIWEILAHSRFIIDKR
uniref:Uncharacterized protein n=1 Tax=Amphimedon queenslandica TaxID=400682 RepID=A0A1X7VWW8_AMPQE